MLQLPREARNTRLAFWGHETGVTKRCKRSALGNRDTICLLLVSAFEVRSISFQRLPFRNFTCFPCCLPAWRVFCSSPAYVPFHTPPMHPFPICPPTGARLDTTPHAHTHTQAYWYVCPNKAGCSIVVQHCEHIAGVHGHKPHLLSGLANERPKLVGPDGFPQYKAQLRE